MLNVWDMDSSLLIATFACDGPAFCCKLIIAKPFLRATTPVAFVCSVARSLPKREFRDALRNFGRR
jgi:hypothetical protein